ncbi:MAG: DUF2281 domain-containing protein [bacterium]|nr:DUF2281 domain-containing protein [bacterium]
MDLNEIINSLTDDQKEEVVQFIQSLMARGAQRPRTRLRQDWAGAMSGGASGSAVELQRSVYQS